jgi:hypothetical protein
MFRTPLCICFTIYSFIWKPDRVLVFVLSLLFIKYQCRGCLFLFIILDISSLKRSNVHFYFKYINFNQLFSEYGVLGFWGAIG